MKDSVTVTPTVRVRVRVRVWVRVRERVRVRGKVRVRMKVRVRVMVSRRIRVSVWVRVRIRFSAILSFEKPKKRARGNSDVELKNCTGTIPTSITRRRQRMTLKLHRAILEVYIAIAVPLG